MVGTNGRQVLSCGSFSECQAMVGTVTIGKARRHMLGPTSVLSLASCLILGKFLMFFQPFVAVLADWLFLLFQTVP